MDQQQLASFNYPVGLAVDKHENIYVCDQWNNKIRKIDSSGIITTIVGNGPLGYLSGGFGGDGGLATSAAINFPNYVTLDGSGNIYFSDAGNQRIRKIDTLSVINTIAGSGLRWASVEMEDLQLLPEMYGPEGLFVDKGGNVIFCDWANNRVRKVNSSGIINTIVGDGTAGFAGDGGGPLIAELNEPGGVIVSQNRVYICETGNSRVRMIDTSDIITTSVSNLSEAPSLLEIFPLIHRRDNFLFSCVASREDEIATFVIT